MRFSARILDPPILEGGSDGFGILVRDELQTVRYFLDLTIEPRIIFRCLGIWKTGDDFKLAEEFLTELI
jgi:hypothetical protein